jgi:hypothetical protein
MTMTTKTTTDQTTAPTNGQIFKDGRWWLMCGAALVPIRVHDAQGKPMPPPEKEQEQANDTT